MWERFPEVAALDFQLGGTKFAHPHFGGKNLQIQWLGTPAAYPTGFVRSSVKEISIEVGGMHVRELQEMIKSCTSLERLEMKCLALYLDREHITYPDDLCTISLDEQAETLERLVVSTINTQPIEPDGVEGWYVDLRWLQLFRLSALKFLQIESLLPHESSFSQLGNLKDLETLVFDNLRIEDKDLTAILPCMPRLRCVRLIHCLFLSFRILQWLPRHLDVLDVSYSFILSSDFPLEDGGVEALTHTSGAEKGTLCVVELVAEGVRDPYFGHFLYMYSGASLTHLNLSFSEEWSSPDAMVYLLSRTPNLVDVNLSYTDFMDGNVYGAVSKLGQLSKLNLASTVSAKMSDCERLGMLKSGPCRQSLAVFCGFEAFLDTDGGVTFFKDHFPRCVFDLST